MTRFREIIVNLFHSRVYVARILIPSISLTFLGIRSAILQLPDLFVSAVNPEGEESGPEERNEADNLDVYRCPVFMNRVSFNFIFQFLSFDSLGVIWKFWAPSPLYNELWRK